MFSFRDPFGPDHALIYTDDRAAWNIVTNLGVDLMTALEHRDVASHRSLITFDGWKALSDAIETVKHWSKKNPEFRKPQYLQLRWLRFVISLLESGAFTVPGLQVVRLIDKEPVEFPPSVLADPTVTYWTTPLAATELYAGAVEVLLRCWDDAGGMPEPVIPADPAREPIEGGNQGADDEASSDSGYLVSELMSRIGVTHKTLHKYAVMAKVRVPRRGQRSFRYSIADAREILQTMGQRTSDAAIKKACLALLASAEFRMEPRS